MSHLDCRLWAISRGLRVKAGTPPLEAWQAQESRGGRGAAGQRGQLSVSDGHGSQVILLLGGGALLPGPASVGALGWDTREGGSERPQRGIPSRRTP